MLSALRHHAALDQTVPPRSWSSRGLRIANTLLIVLFVSALIAFVIVSYWVSKPPYDFQILMRGAESYCFDNTHFQFGLEQHSYYAAPFYTTFCLPNHYAEPLLRWGWMLAPFFLALWLARERAAVFGYAPLGILLLIGQSSWLMLPLYMLALWQIDERHVPAWYGLIFGIVVLKPQVAVVAVMWLVYRWRQQKTVLLVGALAIIAMSIPAFVLRPGWLWEWLPNGRGFEPVNLASVAFIPVQLGQMDFAPGAGAQAVVWGFCALVGLVVYSLLRWRRGTLTLYDWVLVFFLISPVLNDYDLVVLLPFIANRPRRLMLALTAGVVTWLFAMMTKRWSMSFMITLALLVLRLWRLDDQDGIPQAQRTLRI
jgi:hypothetical protein